DGAMGELEDILRKGDFRRLAIANPKLAPYGRAALETLHALGLSEQLFPKLVMGENIGQAYAMTATGAAEFGFVAQAQLQSDTGVRWNVPDHLHTPIRQDAVHLTRAKNNPAATAFMRFLASEDAAELLTQLGYLRPGA
ncbi:MAG: molybdate ABC transporter substrate-binding protein, partial [Pseudomonadota bacterium]